MGHLRNWQKQWRQMDPIDRAPYLLAGALAILIGVAVLLYGLK